MRTHRLGHLATSGVVGRLTHSDLLSRRVTGLVNKRHCGVLQLLLSRGGGFAVSYWEGLHFQPKKT